MTWWQRVKAGLGIVGAALGILWVVIWRGHAIAEAAGDAEKTGADRIKKVQDAAAEGDTGRIDKEWNG